MTTVQPTPIDADEFGVEISLARIRLAKFIQRKASETEARLGFGFVGVAEAPCTYQQLRGAFITSRDTKVPLPVSSLFCDTSIYWSPRENQMFRFWHDVSHIEYGLSFTLADELELALWHLDEFERDGHTRTCLEFRMLEADLVGQLQLMGLIGRFPYNQRLFVEDCLRFGFHEGVLEEIRRIEPMIGSTGALVPVSG
ncbi:MAG: hypothetical protein V9F04_11070 [Dermatophilaceae bacterium]